MSEKRFVFSCEPSNFWIHISLETENHPKSFFSTRNSSVTASSCQMSRTLIYFQKEARYRGQKFRKDIFLGNPCFNEGKTSVGFQDLNLLTSRENQELAKFVKYQQTCAEIERVFSLQSQKIRQWTLKQLPNCIVTQTASGYN